MLVTWFLLIYKDYIPQTRTRDSREADESALTRGMRNDDDMMMRMAAIIKSFVN